MVLLCSTCLPHSVCRLEVFIMCCDLFPGCFSCQEVSPMYRCSVYCVMFILCNVYSIVVFIVSCLYCVVFIV